MFRVSKFAVVLLCAVFAIAFFGMAAFAASPRFLSANATVGSAGNLKVSFEEVGLRKVNGSIVYKVSTTIEDVIFACIDSNGNQTKLVNEGNYNGNGSFTFAGKNGSVRRSLTLNGPVAPFIGDISCLANEKPVFVYIRYGSVSLEDVSNTVTVNIPGTFEKCLFPGIISHCP